jgi:ribosomal protein L19
VDPRIVEIEKTQVRSDLPAFSPGDTVRVRVRVSEGAKERIQAFEGICIARKGGSLNETWVSEGAKERIQAFEGICIARKGGSLNETFTVRKISGAAGSRAAGQALLPAGAARQERKGTRAALVGGRRFVAQGRG